MTETAKYVIKQRRTADGGGWFVFVPSSTVMYWAKDFALAVEIANRDRHLRFVLQLPFPEKHCIRR